ncbi:MAG: hypothetical protein FJ028_07050 [Chloroflexi bacterium]|nr:hypothetical protein [Chloroflexota bacterium]
MADFRPVMAEGPKARILMVKPAPAGTTPDRANAEWVEVRVDLDSDLANWRVARVRALWREEVERPVEWEWVYTFGSPHFAKAGEIYRIHSGSIVRAAMHPVADDLAPGRKHAYAGGPVRGARLLWSKGDYVRLVDAFGTVIDEVVVWPASEAPPSQAPAAGSPAPAR